VLDADRPYSWLDTDGETALADLARMLVDLGHRRFALMLPDVPYTYAHFRRRGFETALAAAGLHLAPDAIAKVAPGDEVAAAAAARRLLERPDRPTALVALTDRLAFAALDVARQIGLSVPADLSVTGFDNLPMAAYATPSLSTFDQRTRESGRVVGEMIVARIDRGEAGIETRLVQPQFVARGSHGPAPAGRR
jgi:LacI family transcriptional regulator